MQQLPTRLFLKNTAQVRMSLAGGFYTQRLSAHSSKDYNCSVVNNSLYVLN